MDETARMHELLPWYLTGTLDARLAEGFREHLAECHACGEELSMLEALRREFASHGDAFLADHPSPDRIVRGMRGELAVPEAAEVRKHLALCVSCAEESSWISGESTYGEAAIEVGRPGRIRLSWTWAAAALAVALLASIPWLVFTGSRGVRTGVVPVHHLETTRLGGGQPNVFVLEQGQAELVLILQVDVAPESLPLTVTLVDGKGDIVHRHSGISTLLNGYLHFACARRDCPAGRYTLQVQGSDGPETSLSFDFEVVEP